jgi:flagellar basal-body rod protein FlgF
MSIDKALFIATSGASEVQKAQAMHAANIANSSTAGFKAQYEAQRALPVYNNGLPTRVYATTHAPGYNQASGSIVTTNNNLHAHIKGKGFFTVVGENNQEGYTRRADLQIDASGQLINGDGYPLLGNGGIITLPPSKNVNISADGEVFVTPLNSPSDTMVQVDKLKLVNPDSKSIMKSHDGLFRLEDGSLAPNAEGIKVGTGGYEGSNVNSVNELITLMELSRKMEMGLKVVSAVKDNAQSSSRLLSLF